MEKKTKDHEFWRREEEGEEGGGGSTSHKRGKRESAGGRGGYGKVGRMAFGTSCSIFLFLS